MEFSRKQISTILEALKASPRGMNVSEVSRATGMNRSTVAKYLEMLYVSGQADRRTFGTSKLYYISQRMPISAFLSFSSDLIIILDKYSRVLNANDSFFEFTGIQREDVVHKSFDNFAFPLKFNPSIMPYIKDAIDGHEATIESYYPKKESGQYFNIKLIPLLFDDGDKGATIIFEDITEKKLAEKALLNANFELEKKVKERTKELEKANEALRKSEAYLLEAGQIARLGYWSYDFRTKESNASDETIRLFGLGHDTRWSQELFRSMVHPEDIPKIEKVNKEAMSLDTPIDHEYRIKRPDGNERIIHSIRGTRRNEAGKVVEIFGTIQDITEQKLMEIALKESEERYRMITEKSYDIVFSVKPDGTISYVSPQIIYYGYDPRQLNGRSFFEFIPASYRDFIAGKFRETMLNGESPPIEFKFLGEDGTEHWAEVTARMIYDDTGKPLFNVGTVRDIEERKKAEEALRNSELKFKTLFESASTAIFIIDLGTRAITDCNTYAARLIGRTKEELVGMHHSKLHPDERAEPCRRNEKIHSKDGSVMNFEAELVHSNGRRIPVLINAAILEIDGKRSMIGSYLDITERKHAEEALQNSEEKFRALAESSSIGVILIQGENTIYANKALADLFGYTIDECLNMKYWDLVQQDMKEQLRQRALLRQQGEPGPARKEFKIVKKNGELMWLDCTAAMLQVKGKPAMMLTAMDITERKRAEEALQNSEEKFRALAESSNIGILLIQGMDIIYVNRALSEMFGYTIDECMNLKYWDTALPEMKEHIRMRAILRQRGEPGPSRNELKMVKKNGEFIWLDCTAAMLQVKGKPAMMLTAMDITRQKVMEQELRKSEEKYRNLVEKVPVQIWEIDENFRCTYLSPITKEIFGYEPGEALGMTPFDFIAPHDLERVRELVTPCLKEHEPFDINEYCMVRKDCREIYIRTIATPIFDDKGQFTGYRGINRQVEKNNDKKSE